MDKMTVHDSDKTEIEDFEYSRSVYYQLLQTGQEALEQLTDFADQNPHPRSYEVLANTIKTISDVNDRLMDLQKKKRELKGHGPKELPAPEKGGTTNVFVGSTEELQRMLADQRMKDVTPNDGTE